MARKMVINAVDPEEVRIAILERGVLVDLDVETRGTTKNKGNIYKGVVKAVEPALNAAFVDYGADKQGFLSAGDVNTSNVAKKDDGRHIGIADALKPNQEILVQVETDEVGAKGAVLTTFLSLAGRYTVLMPGTARTGVSRRVQDEKVRDRMREAANMLKLPDDMGVIVRTAGMDRTKMELTRDLKVLLRLWENIQKTAKKAKSPSLILKEQDVIIRALRDYFTSDIDEIVLDDDDAYDRAAEYMRLVMPKQHGLLTRYVERRPIFHHYKIEEQLETIYAHRVELPSGGSIVIEPTEALVSIDVNSGKQKLKGQEETARQTNIEAAREVSRHLRLRDLGGIVVVDFIDMVSRSNRSAVEREMRAALRSDKARTKIGRISSNGTLEITRQRIRSALQESIFRECSFCKGTGHILNATSHSVAILRRLRDRAARGDLASAKVRVEPEAANHLRTEKWSAIQALEQRWGITIEILIDRGLSPGQDDFAFATDPNAKALEMPEPDFGPEESEPRQAYDGVSAREDEDDGREQRDPESVKKRARNRHERRHKKPTSERGRADAILGARAAPYGGSGELALPSFEFVDPSEVVERASRSTRRPGRNGDGKDSASGGSRRRSRRRGGRGRKRSGREQPGAAAKTAASGNAVVADKAAKKPRGKIASFISRLFG